MVTGFYDDKLSYVFMREAYRFRAVITSQSEFSIIHSIAGWGITITRISVGRSITESLDLCIRWTYH
jgi:hypothetical protein